MQAQLDRPLGRAAVRWALDPTTAPKGASELEVYTTRPDTLFGASFMAIAPDHPLAKAAAANNPGARRLLRGMPAHGHVRRRAIESAEKKGFDTGIRAVHPFDPTGSCRSTSPTSS